MQQKQQLLILFGPPAVGKMTVGKIIQGKLGYRLYHDYQPRKLIQNYFNPNDHPFTPLLSKVRRTILEEVAASYLSGFIVTYIWDLQSESDRNYIDQIVNLFEKYMWQVRFVELSAKLGTRMKRNRGEDRIKEKPMKSDVEKSEAEIIEYEDYQLNTEEDFNYPEEYLKIDTTNLSAEETASQIIDHFSLKDLPEQEFYVEDT